MQPRVVWGCGGVIKFIESCLREGTEGTLYKNILYFIIHYSYRVNYMCMCMYIFGRKEEEEDFSQSNF